MKSFTDLSEIPKYDTPPKKALGEIKIPSLECSLNTVQLICNRATY